MPTKWLHEQPNGSKNDPGNAPTKGLPWPCCEVRRRRRQRGRGVGCSGILFPLGILPPIPCRMTGVTLPHTVTSNYKEMYDGPCGRPLFLPVKPYSHTISMCVSRKRPPLGPYSRPMPRALWWSLGGVFFLMSEVPRRCGEVPRQVDLQGYLTQPPAPPLGPYCMPMPRVKRGS